MTDADESLARLDRDFAALAKVSTEHAVEIRQLREGQRRLADRIDANAASAHEDSKGVSKSLERGIKSIHERMDVQSQWTIGLLLTGLLTIAGWVVTHL